MGTDRPASTSPAVWPQSAVRLAYRPKPFGSDREVATLPFGLTYAEILARTVEDPVYRSLAVITADGAPIPAHLLRAKPKAGTFVTVAIVPQNGRQVLTAAAIIAVAVLSVYTGGLAASLAGGAGTFAGAAAGAAVGAAVTVAGTLTCGLAAPLLPEEVLA